MHCSLPRPPWLLAGHPALPVTAVETLRLVPFGPLTNIRNVFPASADVKLNSASIRLHVTILNPVACIVTGFVAVFSTANTLVTFGEPSARQKHAPVISTSCRIPHGPPEGVTLNTTGALMPRSIVQIVVLVNGPNTLFRPAVNVVVTVNLANPPQHAAGNPEQFNNWPW